MQTKEAFVRQRKSRGAQRTKVKKYYRMHKTKIRQRAKVWRKRNKNRIKITRRRYQTNPSAHRRIASFDSNIVFSFGASDATGVVVGITDMGAVMFDLDTVLQSEYTCCLPIDIFVDLAVFDTVSDAQAFFAWADSVLEMEEGEGDLAEDADDFVELGEDA